jgi:Sulfotransferase domain
MVDQHITSSGKGGLKIIGAGFGRTGTLSLKAALEELGFGPCYHMIEVFSRPDDAAQWEALTRGEPIDLHKLMAGYQAAVDWPACAFYEELMQAYPDAKVLLTVRDPEKWYASASNTIYQSSRRLSGSRVASPLSIVASIFFRDRKRVGRMINALIWERTFGGKFEDKDHAIAVFNQHIESVKDRVPPGRLLVYNVKEGWEPLCAFLGVEVPRDRPFPHLNERASFAGNRRRSRERLVGAMLIGSMVAVLLFFVILILRRQMK